MGFDRDSSCVVIDSVCETNLNTNVLARVMLEKTRFICRAKWWIFLSLFVVLASGCATTGAKPAEMQAELASVPANKGRIYFYRNSSIVGVAVQPNISLNGLVVGESKPGGFFYADVAPGMHEVTSRTEVMANVTVPIREGETRYVRSSVTMGVVIGRIELTLVEASQASQEISSLSFTGIHHSPPASAPAVMPVPATATRPVQPRAVTLDDLDALLPKK
jgi:hypothetical protein